MRVDPHRTLVIEDSVSGVKAGKAAGMTVWGFVGGSHYQSRDGNAILREAGADRVFERMANFWRTHLKEFDGGIRQRETAPGPRRASRRSVLHCRPHPHPMLQTPTHPPHIYPHPASIHTL